MAKPLPTQTYIPESVQRILQPVTPKTQTAGDMITMQVAIPPWARFIAQDLRGDWWVFSKRPAPSHHNEWDLLDGRIARLVVGFNRNPHWLETLAEVSHG